MTSVIVTDNTGCFTKDSIQISTQYTLELSTSSLPISCTTDEGTAVVSVVGGTPNYTYNWSNGGTTSSTQVLVSGTYIVFVTDASGCVSEDSIIVAPANIPISIASSNSSICEGETLNLLATNSPTIGSSYSWTGPNGFISNLQNPLIIPSTILSSGDYILTIMANDCSSISTTSVVIKENPHANFSSNILTGCEPLEVKFTDLSVPISTTVLWNFGDGTTSSSSGIISHIFTSAGDYDISLLSMSSGCSSTITLPQLIHVSPPPRFCLSISRALGKPFRNCSNSQRCIMILFFRFFPDRTRPAALNREQQSRLFVAHRHRKNMQPFEKNSRHCVRNCPNGVEASSFQIMKNDVLL